MKRLALVLLICISAIAICGSNSYAQNDRNDTIITTAFIDGNDTFPITIHPAAVIWSEEVDPKRIAELDRLRYNVYKVYPYAVTAAYILKKVEDESEIRTKKKDRKAYINSLDKELNERFKDELKNLSVNQGKILVKLVNRETGRDVYSILKELKGGVNARVYQTAFKFIDNNLKTKYDPEGEDKDIERIVLELERQQYKQYLLSLESKQKK